MMWKNTNTGNTSTLRLMIIRNENEKKNRDMFASWIEGGWGPAIGK